jgi:hypothetical protein
MVDRNVMRQAFTVPGILKNGNNVTVAAADGFTADKRAKGKKETLSTSAKSLKKNRQPMIGVRNSSLFTVVRRVKMKYIFVCRLKFRPQILKIIRSMKIILTHVHQAEEKFQTYAYFHVSVTEEDLPQLKIWEFGPRAV